MHGFEGGQSAGTALANMLLGTTDPKPAEGGSLLSLLWLKEGHLVDTILGFLVPHWESEVLTPSDVCDV